LPRDFCRLLGLGCPKQAFAKIVARLMYYYKPKLVDDAAIIDELSALDEKHPKYGFRELFMRLRNQVFSWNHKRVYRIYCIMKP